MPISKICEQCNKIYSVPPVRADKSRFCCMGCRNASDRTAERRELICENCATVFTTKKDHDRWPKFCSRECFSGDALKPKEKECATCGSLFVATRATHETDDGYRKYCSVPCRAEGLKRGDEYQCLNCGDKFWLSSSKLQQRTQAGCCSKECRDIFYTGANSKAFKRGFYTDINTNVKRILMSRPGYADKYISEHRLVASRAIGRLVSRNEFVIRVNRNPEDNRPENLFICASNSEYSRRRNGSLPWPTQSNLTQFK